MLYGADGKPLSAFHNDYLAMAMTNFAKSFPPMSPPVRLYGPDGREVYSDDIGRIGKTVVIKRPARAAE